MAEGKAEENTEVRSTWDRRYYRNGPFFIKRSARPSEYIYGLRGLLIPQLAKERLQNEAETLKFIRENTTIPVPTLQSFHEEDGSWCLVTEFIEGTALNDLPEDQKPKVWPDLRRHLSSLRNLKSRILGGPSGLIIVPSPIMVTTNQDIWKLQSSDQEEYVFCHNDLSEYNIIVDEATFKVKAIIDWEYAGFFPAFFERPVYTRHGPRAQKQDDPDHAEKMLHFLRSHELGKTEESFKADLIQPETSPE